ncbi:MULTISPECIES: helix-turn-helix transcriptional regulator [Moorena]|uniref:Two-component response regulator, CheY subfamily n=1 Tax=Moorena producens 3L TaxID=489825 RepID=F4XR61_9CYAN|nr:MULTISPECIES: helix-turn-helix transcriptional regulator [Moorena]NEQ17980.1 helix-turn-helix transcriptional regulator [Moorena sp. SIO3E2]EGJ33036.1 two-component response regulator, CheY subfamily [Moorena producens 3L]NEP33752.1 helix-turn-helix transcriptional regulator [Moorena sp. SIO3B2]NEP70234.1 helix-turn-helix transcriptional regulator [Moorena sp. SIO3A5]NEQ08143.1 helix-turn-helix transcriptional regulator [Moorena sp. SIO4E2]
MYTLTNTLEKSAPQVQQLDNGLLQGVLEGFIDGVLILNTQGDLVHSNETARVLCEQLTPNSKHFTVVPKEIWRVCQALKESDEFYAHQSVIIDSEITTSHSTTFRIRARWLNLRISEQRYIIVTLEDQRQSIHSIALAEVQKYGLTAREAEVWLLRRVNYSYKEIAAELFVTLNTVKKHMKNILAKQQMAMMMEEMAA